MINIVAKSEKDQNLQIMWIFYHSVVFDQVCCIYIIAIREPEWQAYKASHWQKATIDITRWHRSIITPRT